jgi:hypothetical protein
MFPSQSAVKLFQLFRKTGVLGDLIKACANEIHRSWAAALGLASNNKIAENGKYTCNTEKGCYISDIRTPASCIGRSG